MLSRRNLVGVAVSCLMVVAAACSDDSSSGDAPAEEDPAESTTTTQPPASDEAAIRPFIEDLLANWDVAMTDVLADPRVVADDPDNELAGELAASFTGDSPYVEDLSELLGSYVSQDVGLRPGPSGGVQRTTLVRFTEAPSEDHTSFVFCSFGDAVQYRLSSGDELPPSVGVTQGAGEAKRVDGAWRLYRLRQLDIETQPAGTPDPCPGLVEEEPAT